MVINVHLFSSHHLFPASRCVSRTPSPPLASLWTGLKTRAFAPRPFLSTVRSLALSSNNHNLHRFSFQQSPKPFLTRLVKSCTNASSKRHSPGPRRSHPRVFRTLTLVSRAHRLDDFGTTSGRNYSKISESPSCLRSKRTRRHHRLWGKKDDPLTLPFRRRQSPTRRPRASFLFLKVLMRASSLFLRLFLGEF